MAGRKWLVRGLVFSLSAGLAGAGYLYQHWTNPAAVRQIVLHQLGGQLVGANISLNSAHMRLLGGIFLEELRLSRRDDPDQADFAYVPAATIYPDKEQAVNGKLAIRKVELDRPCLRVRRGADGRWNLSGLLAPPHPDEPVPTLQVRRGTIIVEDQAKPGPPLEVTDVDLTLLNDPIATVRFQGTGVSGLAGRIHITGTFQRTSGALAVSIRGEDMDVGPALMQRLGAYVPELAEYAAELRGKASFQAEFGYSPATVPAWSHQVRWRLTGGRYHHPSIPRTLEDVELTLACVDGHVSLERGKARSGAAFLEVTAEAQALNRDADCRVHLTVTHLPMSADLFDNLPPRLASLKRVDSEYAPRGPVTVTVHAERRAGQWLREATARPEDATLSFRLKDSEAPFTLEHVTGSVEQVADAVGHREEIHVDLAGSFGGRRVVLKGEITGEPPLSAVDLRIAADDVALDNRVLAALPTRYRRIAASFHPAGRANFEASIRRPRGRPEFINHFLLRFHHAAINYDVFPYPLEEVNGTLDLWPDHWSFQNFRGTHKGGTFRAAGNFRADPTGDQLTVLLEGDEVALDSQLEEAFVNQPELKKAWRSFSPRGRMRFSARVLRRGEEPADVKVDATALRCRVRPDFFPYEVEELTGNFRYDQRWVLLDALQARHGDTHLSLDKGKIYIKPDGGTWAEVTGLKGGPLVPDADLLEALPPVLRTACDAVKLRDPVGLATNLTLSTSPDTCPDVYWDGELSFENAALKTGVLWEQVTGKVGCRGRYDGQELVGLLGNLFLEKATLFNQPFRDVQCAFAVDPHQPNVLAVPGFYGRLFGGEIYGPLSVTFGPTLRYDLELTASGIRLEEFGRRNLGRDNQISGLANAALHLTGAGDDAEALRGRGSVDIPNGRLYNLPPFLDLLKFLAIRIPDGTAFEEAHATFTVRGTRVAISRLDLFGSSISLRGQGELNLDGTDLNLDFYAAWARITQLLPPLIKDIQDLSKYLLKIQMRGRLTEPKFHKEPVPVLVEPLKGLLERMAGRRVGSEGHGPPEK